MANNEMLDDLEFENQINAMGDDQPALIKFVARQQFTTSKILVKHDRRIAKVERANKKAFGLVGAASAILATAITATLDFIIRRPP